jgi:menaquinone-dependent protoporphyrinogen IX oxidase
MRTLVTYHSRSGNTRKVALAAYEGLMGEKELKSIDEVTSLEEYDLVLLGFPVVGEGAPGKVKRFLRKKAIGKKVALLVTHGMPSHMDAFAEVIPNCQAVAEENELVGTYHCQGNMVSWMPKVLRLHPYVYVRKWARMNGESHGAGHPNLSDVEGARAFARGVEMRHAGDG